MMRQALQIADSFRHPTFNFGTGLLHFSNRPLFAEGVAWGLWLLGFLGLFVLGRGGRWAKAGLLLWILAELLLFGGLGWELNAPERIMGWSAAGFLLAPLHGTEDTEHLAKKFTVLWISAMYLMAGWMKITEEPGWWDGSILIQGLQDPIMGGTSIGIAMSHIPWIPKLLDWFTLVFEIGFVFCIGNPRLNPWILLMGLCFHGGVSLVMNVGTLGITVLSWYPVMLEQKTAEWLWGGVRRFVGERGER